MQFQRFNMAKRNLTNIDYAQLNNFSSVVLYNSAPKSKRKTLSGLYNVERIISRRNINNDYEYLIKWEGWPLESCSWEPSNHLNEELIRGYEHPPTPSAQRLEEAGREFFQGILSLLKAKSTATTYVKMNLDIWRYVSRGRGELSRHKGFMLYKIEDMSRLPLPDQWWYWLNIHGEGHAIQPPLKVKAVLGWTSKKLMFKDNKLCQAPQLPIEKLCLDILKRPCNSNNL